MGISWRRTDPLTNRVVRPVSSRDTIYLAVLQRTEQTSVIFTLPEGEDPETVAWDLAEQRPWVEVDRTVLAMKEIRE